MPEHLMPAVTQVAILFILMAAGFVATGAGWLNAEGARQLSRITLCLATPFAIVTAFRHIEPTPETLQGLLSAAVFAAAYHGLAIALAGRLFRGEAAKRRSILRTGVVLANCGYMGIPLATALTGTGSVAYLSVYIAAFNIVTWTYGIRQFQPGERLRAKAIWLNPGFLGLAGGLAVLFLPFELPELLNTPMDALASLSTPLPMLILGYYIRAGSLRLRRENRPVLSVLLLRQIVLPLSAVGLCSMLGLRGLWLCAVMVAACAPSAVNILMLASLHDHDTNLAAQMTAYGHLASILTMPLILSLSMLLFGG